jgi:hypothetical protein
MAFKLDEITAQIRQQIEAFEAPVETADVGTPNCWSSPVAFRALPSAWKPTRLAQ